MQVLIVDDDAMTRSGLMKHTRWDRYPVGMIQMAASAQEALALCVNWQPDVVLSDIRMRGMTGLEMCSLLRERYPDCQMILISAFSEKEYLKSAIEIGVVHYVDKPVSMDTLEAALDKAVLRYREAAARRADAAMVNRSLPYVRRETLLGLFEGRSPESLQTNVLPLPILQPGAMLRAGILRTASPIGNMVPFLDHLEAQFVPVTGHGLRERIAFEFLDNRRMLFMGLESDLPDEAWRRLVERPFDGISLFVALAPPAEGLGRVADAFAEARLAEQDLFHVGYGCCVERAEGGEIVPFDSGIVEAFSAALSQGRDDEADDILVQIRDRMRESRVVLGSGVHAVYYTLLQRVHQQMLRQLPDQSARLRDEFDQRVGELNALETLDGFHTLLAGELDRVRDKGGADAGNLSAVLQVTRTIAREYHRSDLSIRDLADQVFLTPTYLSALFKQKTGTTIGRYLLDVRIQEAKRLLWDRQLKLYHVAERVGFEDANYFAKAFKKAVGLTPSEYRDQEGR